MGLKLYAEEAVRAIAEAIRLKLGTSKSYRIGEMADAIDAFPTCVMLTDLVTNRNGRFVPPSGYTFSRVTVSVPQPSSTSLSVTSNGVYYAPDGYGYSEVSIDVPDYSGSVLSVSANGVYTAQEYEAFNPVVVSIPEYHMTSAAFSENGFYQASELTAWQNITTDVWTGDDVNLVERRISQYSGSVSFIGNHAFHSCSMLTSVYADQCISVGNMAFAYCGSLTTVSLPECGTVETQAFYHCDRLVNLSLPKCTTVNHSAFTFCRRLTEVTLPECTWIGSWAFDALESGESAVLQSISLPKVKQIGRLAFRKCMLLSEIVLPECELIEAGAFYNCSSATRVYAPSCTYIADGYIGNPSAAFPSYYGTFAYCWSLTSVDLPVCSYVGAFTFQYCGSLSEVYLPACTSIGASAFASCANLRSVDLPECKVIGREAFYNCQKLSSLSLPMCEEIMSGAFESCCGLSGTLDLPACKSISWYAFDCRVWNTTGGPGKITSLSLPICETIGGNAFQNHPLTEVYLPNVTSMTGTAFASCYSITYVECPLLETVNNFSGSSYHYTSMSFIGCKSLGAVAFQSLSYLRDVNIPNCETVGYGAFAGCTALESIDLPSCKVISSTAFYGCTSLSSISIPLCTSIWSSAFAGCTNLMSVSMPNVQYLGAQIFNDLSISAFDFPELISTWGSYASSVASGIFGGNSHITTFSAPKLERTTPYMFAECSNLSDVRMPVLTQIAVSTFYHCTALQSIDAQNIEVIGENAMYGTGLQAAEMSYVRYIQSSAFAECSALSYASFGAYAGDNVPSTTQFYVNECAFQNCVNLSEVALLGRYWKPPYSDPSSPFIGTPIYSGSGKIYVDAFYYEDYMSRSEWSWASSFIYSVTV